MLPRSQQHIQINTWEYFSIRTTTVALLPYINPNKLAATTVINTKASVFNFRGREKTVQPRLKTKLFSISTPIKNTSTLGETERQSEIWFFFHRNSNFPPYPPSLSLFLCRQNSCAIYTYTCQGYISDCTHSVNRARACLGTFGSVSNWPREESINQSTSFSRPRGCRFIYTYACHV